MDRMRHGAVSAGRRTRARAARNAWRRGEILRSAGRVLQERGLAGVTMEHVAERLGLTKGSLYYYFEDKEDLLYQCHLQATAASLEALRRARPSLPPDGRLREVLMGHIRGITGEEHGAIVLTDLETIAPARRRRIVAMRDRFERGVRDIIREGIESGVFARVDVRLAGFAILGAINWIPKWYDARGPLSPDEVAAQMADLMVAALRP
jgi:AcrR family transcriptional regulator